MKHSAEVTVDTDDNKALKAAVGLLKPKKIKGKPDSREAHHEKSMNMFLKPHYLQLKKLQEKVQRGLLDLDVSLVKEANRGRRNG